MLHPYTPGREPRKRASLLTRNRHQSSVVAVTFFAPNFGGHLTRENFRSLVMATPLPPLLSVQVSKAAQSRYKPSSILLKGDRRIDEWSGY